MKRICMWTLLLVLIMVDCSKKTTPLMVTQDFNKEEFLVAYKSVIDSLANLKDRLISSEYSLYDISGDGNPELWIISGSCEADKKLYIYTLVEKEPIMFFSNYGDHSDFYVSNDGGVAHMTCFGGGGSVTLYKYVDNNIINSSTIEFSLFNKKGEPEAINKNEKKELKYRLKNLGENLQFTRIE